MQFGDGESDCGGWKQVDSFDGALLVDEKDRLWILSVLLMNADTK